MDTSTSTLLTGLVVTGGQVADGKGVSLHVIVAVLFVAIVLSLMGEANAKLAQQFAALILVAALFTYGPAILKGLGLSKAAK